MFIHLGRAASMMLLGAIGFFFTSDPSQAAPQGDICYGCTAGLASKYIEFTPIPFPDGTICTVRHNFEKADGKCTPNADATVPPCVPAQPCAWKYSVICGGTGTGCFDPAGLPRMLSGTTSFNGVPVTVWVPCGLTQPLPNVACGSQATITNFVWAPASSFGPWVEARTNSMSCAPCQEC